MEFDLDYTDENCISVNVTGNVTCAQFLREKNYTGASCTCVIPLTLTEDYRVGSNRGEREKNSCRWLFRAMFISIMVWWITIRIIVVMSNLVMIINCWANPVEWRRIVNRFKSQSMTPIVTSLPVEQLPILVSMVRTVLLLFLSLSVGSLLSDTLTLSTVNGTAVPMDRLGIAWSTDKAVKFKNPDNASNCQIFLSFFLSLDALICF